MNPITVQVWHHDAAEYMPYQPRPTDMWSRWNFAKKAPSEATIAIEDPWWVRHNVKLPHTIFKLRDIADLDANIGVWRTKGAVPCSQQQ
eukprot:SAG31_NODE_1799_length_7241_cov_11.407029_3_plen_89_part_00